MPLRPFLSRTSHRGTSSPLRRSAPRLGSLLRTALPFFLLLTACPRRFDPRAQEVRGSSPNVEAEYRRGEKLLLDGKFAEAERALLEFRRKVGPAEPLYGLATVMQGRALRQMGQSVQAKELLSPLAASHPESSWLGREVRRELGLIEYGLQNWAASRRWLAALSVDIVDGEEGAELHATLADLHKRAGDVEAALREYERLSQSKAVRPGELLYLRRQSQPLVEQLPQPQRDGWRKRLGLSSPEQVKLEAAQTLRIGLLLPLQGKDRNLGDRVLRGAMWGADLLGGTQQAAPRVDLRIRDSSAGNIAQLVSELAQEGAQVIVTPPTKAEATQVSAEAEKLGMLALCIGPRDAQTPGTFQLLRTNRSRAQALAQHLIKSGLQTVAILAPNTGYGQAMSRAFAETLQGSAVKTVADLSFADGATTFLAEVQKLAKAQPDALFLPVSATQLELISSQLAAGGVVGTYRVSRGPDGEPQQNGQRIKLILSSAEGMGERLLRSAGRYLQGAVLAPLSVGQLAVTGGQVARLDYGSGEEPTSLDALGFDTVRLLRLACQRLGTADLCTARELSSVLHELSIDGATGPLGFDAAGQRTSSAMLLRVTGQNLEFFPP
ncbi:MAG TPA: penicillin-binding protein activator [Pseudomonadota bacterium]|nr:penicillin-binding protein activator [Pseudomonadota bacterium]